MAEPKSSDDQPFIRVRGLKKTLGTQEVLRGVDIDLDEGRTLALIGRSGEGKSVFIKHLLGLMAPDEGTIEIDGTNIVGLGERQLGATRRKVGILFQNGALFNSMTVAENVAFPLRQSGEKDAALITERVHESLDVVQLAEHKDKMPIDLSGGMRKRVALARAMITRPRCLLYDEPTAGLDPIVSDSINHLIRRLQKRYSITSIVVTHDMKSVYHIADRVGYLRGGKVYFYGTVDELKGSDDPLIQDFIEGRSGETDL